MTQPTNDQFLNCITDSISAAHRFSHEAMATVFEIFIIHEEGNYAGQAALAAFDELDKIERNLSRFIENSDISQINRLAVGQSLKLCEDAFRCLQLAADIYDQTNGAFDITVGSLLSCRIAEDKTLRKPSAQDLDLARRCTGMAAFQLDETEHTITLLSGPVQIDLGGIGKGYAVDRMAELLADWSIDTALVHSGQSSVLALGAPPRSKGWPVTLTSPDNPKEILAHLYLCEKALSGSGLQKGPHIIDPRRGLPVEGKIAAWSSAPDGATADALSTAFMVMAPDEIKKYCRRCPDVRAMIILQDESLETPQGRLLHFGSWRFDKQPK